MNEKPRRKYSYEFKKDAVQLIDKQGYTVTEVQGTNASCSRSHILWPRSGLLSPGHAQTDIRFDIGLSCS